MAGLKGRALDFRVDTSTPAQNKSEATEALNDLMLFAMPTELFLKLAKAASDRQMNPAQLFSVALSEYLEKTANLPASED